MSQDAPHHSRTELSEAEVTTYLAMHPDLLLRYPQLLAQLELRHRCGDASSLIERQVSVLRSENSDLRHNLDELLRIARYNDRTAERLHELTLELLRAADLQAAIECLRAGLREGFQADGVGLLLIAEPGECPPQCAAESAMGELCSGPADAALEPFRALLSDGRPVCGPPSTAQAERLFPEIASTIASAAVVPLYEDRPLGVLGIGSSDAQRYHPEQGTVFLRRLGAIVARTLQRLLTPASAGGRTGA
ncbi:DUF484 family protein [Halorhodospira abdelmalekii]|uniref:DUF484 family protein n=1 Tax=Halorhodospira abdelmalekii TaxID=421629 RepID=UPI0019038880